MRGGSVAHARRVAGLAVTLAAIGIYGVISYGVMEQTREIGIRMALGAGRGTVASLILKRGILMAALGLAGGLVGSLAVARFLASHLLAFPRPIR